MYRHRDIIERETVKIKAVADLIIDADAAGDKGGFSESQIAGIAFILQDSSKAIENAAFGKNTDTDPEQDMEVVS